MVTVRRLNLSFSLVGQCAKTFLNFFDPFLKLFMYPSGLMESLFMFSLFSIVFLVKIIALRSLSQTRLLRMSPDSLNCSIVLNLPLKKQSSKVSCRIRILFASYTCLVKKGMSSRLLSSLDLTKTGFRKIWLFYNFRLLTIALRREGTVCLLIPACRRERKYQGTLVYLLKRLGLGLKNSQGSLFGGLKDFL